MNAQLKVPIEPQLTRSEEVTARIESERRRLDELESGERELSTSRIRLLTSADDNAVDECERSLDQNRGQQIRILERLDLLESELKQAREQEAAQRLDELTATASHARERGLKIIRQIYPALAKKIAEALSDLRAVDDTIDTANAQLKAANREQIDSTNSPRASAFSLLDTVNLPNAAGESDPYWRGLNEVEKHAKYLSAQFIAGAVRC